MNDVKVKQQVVDQIKEATNILVTVSSSPSVDELSSALGLTLLLNKMGKHATAIFSGDIPPAITFLDPEKTFESTADSLRDFIIALDKEKADHLRYKLDGDMVKIFITPYRTTITGDDLEFSQGDYNVELVLALGVEDQESLDKALDAHGRILHDATVATISAGEQASSLGSIDWRDANASSLSEMLVGLVEAFKSDKAKLDEQTATAFLTGIVAATDRFSNTRTSSRVMTMAAQLMAAGADQQLIAAKLQDSQEISQPEEPEAPTNDKGEMTLEEGETAKLDRKKQEKKAAKKDDGSLVINHEKVGTLDEVAKETHDERLAEAAQTAEQAFEELPKKPDVIEELADTPLLAPQPPMAEPTVQEPPLKGAVNWTPATQDEEPMLGGTLNATTDQAEEDKRKELASDKNKTILTHSYIGDTPPTYEAPINAAGTPEDTDSVDIFADSPNDVSKTTEETAAPTIKTDAILPPIPAPAEPIAQPVATTSPTLAEIDAQNRASHDDARAAVEAALDAAAPATNPAAPVSTPSLDLPPPPPLPDFSNLPLPPEPERLGDIFAPDAAASTAPAPQAQSTPADPGQFKIPGQG